MATGTNQYNLILAATIDPTSFPQMKAQIENEAKKIVVNIQVNTDVDKFKSDLEKRAREINNSLKGLNAEPVKIDIVKTLKDTGNIDALGNRKFIEELRSATLSYTDAAGKAQIETYNFHEELKKGKGTGKILMDEVIHSVQNFTKETQTAASKVLELNRYLQENKNLQTKISSAITTGKETYSYDVLSKSMDLDTAIQTKDLDLARQRHAELDLLIKEEDRLIAIRNAGNNQEKEFLIYKQQAENVIIELRKKSLLAASPIGVPGKITSQSLGKASDLGEAVKTGNIEEARKLSTELDELVRKEKQLEIIENARLKNEQELAKVTGKSYKEQSRDAEKITKELVKYQQQADRFLEKAKILGVGAEPGRQLAKKLQSAISVGDTDLARDYAKQLDTVNSGINAMGKSAYSWSTEMGIAIRRTIEWATSIGLVYGAMDQLRKGIGYIKELDAVLTKIQVLQVDGAKTRTEIDSLSRSFNDLAINMGATTLEVAEGSTEWLNFRSL